MLAVKWAEPSILKEKLMEMQMQSGAREKDAPNEYEPLSGEALRAVNQLIADKYEAR